MTCLPSPHYSNITCGSVFGGQAISPKTVKTHLEQTGFRVERFYTATDDYSRGKLFQIIRQLYHPASEEESRICPGRIETQGQGEAIHFFARKPEMMVVKDHEPD